MKSILERLAFAEADIDTQKREREAEAERVARLERELSALREIIGEVVPEAESTLTAKEMAKKVAPESMRHNWSGEPPKLVETGDGAA